ncbi:DNA polymerase III subunit gamma/tau [Acinetobacter sp. ANC 4648]|uniref:DNA polymerase III subunit gamma/tau n=1 Tax=Acinetobacter sp. ANC 4648 TaxID=1977875 RepID=UPI000A3438C7|nr:DNA polymerase III subunit gamma/tau [Acinetobacter sp. ANC 4648]OTG82926.1 hypothetical protein B9T27_06555 [Acinetobacter sp. ANC 4648]
MYQVLARKYRPRNFNELVGQNHVSRALTSALDRGRLHHAYLFTGTRGVGKTTIARILAKCLNCETGITSTPCEVCATCTAVNEGRFIDLIEIDAASRTKVEDTRELLDNVPYAPTQGRFKVYLIDEVHMLSTHSFNALLKTLEEPPEHVKFLFATTDPQKLPITVISRCLQFTLRPLAVDEITHHLTDILNKEAIQSEQDALWQLAESAQGSLRDALSLTDQAIAYGQGVIHHQDVKEMLGLIDRTIIYDLILAIHQNQPERVSQLLLQFRQQALDVSLVLDQFISTLHELAMLQYLPDLSLKYSAEINKKIMQLSQLISAQDLQLYYQIACKGRAELQISVTQEQGFEMTILRLLAFRPLQFNEILVSQTQVAPLDVTQPQIVNDDTQSTHQNTAAVQEQNSQLQHVQSHQVNDVQNTQADAFDQSEDIIDDQQQNTHEPSSDDFLDEPIEAQSSIESVEQPNNVQEIKQIDSITENTTLEVVPELSLFGGESIQSNTPVISANVLNHDADVFFLATETETHAEQDNVAVIEAVPQQSIVASLEYTSISSRELSTNQTPQEILKLVPQVLEGEWNVEKWEYWFRNSALSPAVQELAQHGVMTGQIDGESLFHIPQKYEKLLFQAQHDLEAELKQNWPNSRFLVQYGDVDEITPFNMQNERKVKAFDRAAVMLHQESVVKNLVEVFDADLKNIQLK